MSIANAVTGRLIQIMERGMLPDLTVRAGIRHLCKTRLKTLSSHTLDDAQENLNHYLDDLRSGPIAIHTEDANKQHYELPPEFFGLVLGKNRKYSSAFWPIGCGNLDEAEDLALALTCARAELLDGQDILELGCGWGSLSLYMAMKFPRSRITALSNSAPQRKYIEGEAKRRGLTNLQILTRNISETQEITENNTNFDRVVSVEMFEHLKNYQVLLERISKWLKPEGKLFVHIFTHKLFSYPFETEGEDNWMGKYFFTGGQMPGHHLLTHFQDHLKLEQQWAWNGSHYSKTAAAWLKNLDQNRTDALAILDQIYGHHGASEKFLWLNRWRVFFMSCEELFGYQDGSEWGVSHYLFKNRKALN